MSTNLRLISAVVLPCDELVEAVFTLDTLDMPRPRLTFGDFGGFWLGLHLSVPPREHCGVSYVDIMVNKCKVHQCVCVSFAEPQVKPHLHSLMLEKSIPPSACKRRRIEVIFARDLFSSISCNSSRLIQSEICAKPTREASRLYMQIFNLECQ